MSATAVTPITFKCKICAGDIVSDYLTGTCACANCGNKWNISDMIPGFDAKYGRIITNINKANDMLENNSKVASSNEARLLFKTCSIECRGINDAVSAELVKICESGQKKAELLATYVKGKNFFDKQQYSSAMTELKKVKGFRDTDAMLAICQEEMQKKRVKLIPLAVIISLIAPTAVALFFKEKFSWPIPIVIMLILAGSAGLGYLLYRGGVPAIIIKIVSFVIAAPLLLYIVLAYMFHVPVIISVLIAVGIPIVLGFIVLGIATTGENKNNNKK